MLLVAFPVWTGLWQIVARPLFVVSGIFFILFHRELPTSRPRTGLNNPLIHITGEMRRGVYAT